MSCPPDSRLPPNPSHTAEASTGLPPGSPIDLAAGLATDLPADLPADLIDQAVLSTHASELGADLIRQIGQRFLEDAPSGTQAIRDALAAGDAEAARRAAHRLGGGALSVGMVRVAARTKAAEALLRAGGLAAAGEALAQLLRDLPEDYTALAQALDRLD